MRPLETISPGEAIPASEYNRAMQEISRQSRWNSAAPIVITNDLSGFRVAILDKPMIWVRVTGNHTTGYGAGGGHESTTVRYSGIEQTDDDDHNGTYDLIGGIEFVADGLYLKEINGRTDVPSGVIVRAYQSNNGNYYTFMFSAVEDAIQSIISIPNTCPFWNCFEEDNVDPFPIDCVWCWVFTPDGPCAEIDDYCGCTPTGPNYNAAGCWPYFQGMDLGSTGISLNCMVGNFDGILALRDACLVLVPGGPFGMRLALISRVTGREFRADIATP